MTNAVSAVSPKDNDQNHLVSGGFESRELTQEVS